MKRIMMTMGALLALGACTNEDGARSVLEAQGFTRTEFNGYAWLSCGEDAFKNAFQANAPNGRRVNVAVCCGWMKNCTVRVEP